LTSSSEACYYPTITVQWNESFNEMGKQTKRKQRNKNKQSGGSPIPQQPDASTSNASGSTHVINRIRHGDIRIRHGALTGLSTTIFSPESLSSNGRENVKYELLKAVAERIMDPDMPTAMCSAGCISNYALFGTQQAEYPKVGIMVLPITLARLKVTLDQVVEMHQALVHLCKPLSDSSSSHLNHSVGTEMEKQVKRIMEKWSLVSLCLHIICALIENAESDDSSILLNVNQLDDFLGVILRIVSSTSDILSHRVGTSSTPMDHAAQCYTRSRNRNQYYWRLLLLCFENSSFQFG